jgi:hypothetical protein
VRTFGWINKPAGRPHDRDCLSRLARIFDLNDVPRKPAVDLVGGCAPVMNRLNLRTLGHRIVGSAVHGVRPEMDVATNACSANRSAASPGHTRDTRAGTNSQDIEVAAAFAPERAALAIGRPCFEAVVVGPSVCSKRLHAARPRPQLRRARRDALGCAVGACRLTHRGQLAAQSSFEFRQITKLYQRFIAVRWRRRWDSNPR